MKRFFTLWAALAVTAVTLVASKPKLLQLEQPLMSTQQDMQITTSLKTNAPRKTEATYTPYADNRLPDPSTWTVAEGTWFYYSGYTGKSYPTEVRYIYTDAYIPGSSMVAIQLTNSFFGTIDMSTNRFTGYTFFYYETDETGWNSILPVLNDENGESLGVALRTANIGSSIPVYGNWAVYPLAGNARILTNIIPFEIDENGSYVYDYNTEIPSYDYLYNTQAKDCKITADYARSYYKGEKTAKIKLTKGTDVTDIYYVMAKQIVDEKRTNADPDWVAGQGYSRYTIGYGNIDQYLAEFKAGESNDAYIVGHVAPDATEFEIPLPESEGLRQMIIVAYCGEEITDMVFDMLEVRHPYKWNEYGTISITQDITWANECETFTVIENGDYKVEVNEEGTYYRIVNPFTKNDNPDANYIYLNVPDGKQNKCFIDPSYSPFERTYSFPTPFGTTETYTHPFFMYDLISYNVLNGFYPSDFYNDNDYDNIFIDLTSGKADNHVFIVHDYNTRLQGMGLYINVSAFGNLNMQFPNYIVTSPMGRGISIDAGPDVDYVICSLEYAESNTVTKLADDNHNTFKVKIENGTGFLDLITLLNNNEIPSLPVNVRFTAYNASDESVRTSSVDLSGFIFDNSAPGSVTFTDIQGGNYFINQNLLINRKSINSNNIEYTVKQFEQTLALSTQDTDLDLKFNVSAYKTLYKSPEPIYINSFNLQGQAYPCPIYVEFIDMTYNESPDGDNDTVTGLAVLRAYDIEGNFLGYLTIANITITLPTVLTDATAGIEDVTTEGDYLDQPRYYNLQGIQLDNPQPGTLLIEHRGNSARKVIYRQ